jgi:ABC-type transporter Mla maintaining outer membrane lipid asymmetry ATPase subunit MlaF
MVFQENALFDSLTVAHNVGFRLMDARTARTQDVDARVAEVLGFVGLTGYEERMPSELSGGQRRRVGIARAMASKPGLLLFDDPTTGLDPVIASNVDDEIVKLRDLEHGHVDLRHPHRSHATAFYSGAALRPVRNRRRPSTNHDSGHRERRGAFLVSMEARGADLF